ncbi:MAG: pyridoxal phosphate-dependent aminotransferase [Selenomonas sp.]|nr:pyridoxal phosphate-dependent aminotransferase [Selenomonas sp.]
MVGFALEKEEDFSGLLSKKWEFSRELTGREKVIPLWIADMDFPTVPEVRDALVNRARAGIYGYAAVRKSYYKAVTEWLAKRQGWNVDTESIVLVPGVVTALHVAIHAFSEPGDYILLQTPVYHPFYRTIDETRRRLVENPLVRRKHGYELDFADLEEKLRTYHPKIMILCNPHNPTGRVYTREELTDIARLCRRYDVLVAADEIHGDLILGEKPHIPFLSLPPEVRGRAIACTAPSKTFNIAGLKNSNIIIEDAELRQAFQAELAYLGIPGPALFPLVAGEAAYRHGEKWLEEVIAYLQENQAYAMAHIKEELPKVWVSKTEGTYFLWLDFSAYGFSVEELEKFMLDKAGVWLNQGYIFGKAGQGFVRLNLACSRLVLKRALTQLTEALRKREG